MTIEDKAAKEAWSRVGGPAEAGDLDREYVSGFKNGVHWLLEQKGHLAHASRPTGETHDEDTLQVTEEQVYAERERQVDKGYTPDHDRKHGIVHVLQCALRYAMREGALKTAAMIEAALEIAPPIRHPQPTDERMVVHEFMPEGAIVRHPQPTEGEPSDAQCVRIANMAQEITGRSIWPSTVKAILRVVADQEGENRG